MGKKKEDMGRKPTGHDSIGSWGDMATTETAGGENPCFVQRPGSARMDDVRIDLPVVDVPAQVVTTRDATGAMELGDDPAAHPSIIAQVGQLENDAEGTILY